MSFDAFTALGTLAQASTQISTGILAQKEANQQAEISVRAAQTAREDELRKGRRIAGKQRAAFGKSGVKIDEGTPLDVLAQTAADAELNAIRSALVFERQADNLRSVGKIQLTRGILGAGTTILGKAETFRDLFKSFGSGPAPIVGPTTGAPPTSHTASFGRIA